jgi:beta-glucosidase
MAVAVKQETPRSEPCIDHSLWRALNVPMFPDGFLWGAATAAHQVEGNNVNSDCWLLEHLPGSIFAEPSGDACDHYHRYPEDIATLAGLGLNSYRFSVEWARIEPEEGEFSTAILDHYRRVLMTCQDHGLFPVVTFHHFTSPRWLLAVGGWEDKKTPDRFARYCDRVTRHLGDLIGMACTLNESNLPRLLSSLRVAPPAEEQSQQPMWQGAGQRLGIPPERVAPFQFTGTAEAFDTMLAAHRAGSAAIKSVRADLPVGWTLALADIQAGPGGEDHAAGVRRDVNEIYLEASRDDDFVGVQTYSRTRFGADAPLPPPPGAELNMMGEEFYPEALEATIRLAAAVSGVPIVVTENGLATGDDTRRQVYVQRALQGVANCLRDGIDVRGYIYWTALDNFEWVFGYRPTFGLIAVNRATQERAVKPSARWLGDVARTNGVALQT